MAQNRESLSEISRRRTSWILTVLGLIVLLLFIMVLCSMGRKKNKNVTPTAIPDYTLESTTTPTDSDSEVPLFGAQDAHLSVTPNGVSLDGVVLGSLAEAVLVLRAENGPILLSQKYLAETPENRFVLSGP